MARDGNYLAANQVIWNRKSGQVHALGQCRPADPPGRQAGRRQCPADRHHARRHDRQSDGRARKRRPHRGAGAARAATACISLERRHLFAVPRDHRHRLSKAAELVDYRGARDRRSRQQAGSLRGRPAAAVRHQPAAAADLQCVARHRGGDAACWSPTSRIEPQRFRNRPSLSLADRPKSRRDA